MGWGGLEQEGVKGEKRTAFFFGIGELAQMSGAGLVLVEGVLDVEEDVGLVLGDVFGLDDIVVGFLGAEGLGPGDFLEGGVRVGGVGRDGESVACFGGGHFDFGGVGCVWVIGVVVEVVWEMCVCCFW